MASGFKPTRSMAGGNHFPTMRFNTPASGEIYIGDPVRVSAGVVKALGAVTSGLAAIGVAGRFYTSDGRPLTHSLPVRGPYKTSGQAMQVDVYWANDTVFTVGADLIGSGASARALIGAAVNVTAGTPNTAAGTSGYKVIGTPATAGSGYFKVLGPSPTNIEAFTSASEVEVVLVRSALQTA